MCCITQHLDIFFPPSCQISSTHETSPPSPQPILNYRSTGTETAKAPSGQIRVDDKFAGFLAASHLLIYCSPLHPVTLSPSSLLTPTTRRTPRCTYRPDMVNLSSFQTTSLQKNTVDFSTAIQTRILRVEGEHADH